MNNIKEYQKVTKKEKVEKLIYALSQNNEENGYFEIILKDGSLIIGSIYTIEHFENEPYLVLRNGKYDFYASIKVKSIKLIGPRFFSIK